MLLGSRRTNYRPEPRFFRFKTRVNSYILHGLDLPRRLVQRDRVFVSVMFGPAAGLVRRGVLVVALIPIPSPHRHPLVGIHQLFAVGRRGLGLFEHGLQKHGAVGAGEINHLLFFGVARQ